MSIKICHVTSAHNRYDIRILQKECVSLAEKGYEVSLIVSDSLGYEIFKNVRIHSIDGGGVYSRAQRAKNIRIIQNKALELDADIYHLHDPELLLIAKKLKTANKKVIFDSHENYYAQILEKEYIPRLLRRMVARLYKRVENRMCKYLDGAIFPCEIKGKHIFEGRVKHVAFVDNMPLLNEMNGHLDITKRKRGDAVCCVGSLTEVRGIRYLIDACYQLNIKLVLGGEFFPEDFKNEIQQKKEYSIVDYRGYCARDEVIDIYKECNIGISTILHVGQYPIVSNLPTKVYEYMMLGLPCIISDFDYSKRMIDEYKFGIVVDPSDVSQIMKAIEYLVNNPEHAKKMGENGRTAILEKFNWNIEKNKLFSFYDEIIEN